MGKDVKIGLALGLVVIVVAIVIFSVSGSGDSVPEEDVSRTPSSDTGSAGTGETDRHEEPGATDAGQRTLEGLFDPGLFPAGDDRETPSSPSSGEGAPRWDVRSDAPDTRSILVDRTPEPTTRTVEHVVKGGDTLWGLAKRYYGNALRLSAIHEANRDKLPTQDSPLRIGMKLVIPDVRVETGMAGVGGTAALPSAAVGETPAATEHDTYVVRPGDTLGVIAQRFYGDDRMTRPIISANPRLAANPDRIVVGWKLRIPKPPAGQRTAARDID